MSAVRNGGSSQGLTTRIVALAWMTGALFGFLMMGISARELAGDTSLFQLLVYRNAICLLIMAVILSRLGWRRIATQRFKRHLARNSVHLVGQYLWFFAVISIPLTEVFAIEFTTPIWTAILAAVFLGEQLTRWRVFAIVLAFVGVLLILRPGVAIIQPAALAAVAAAVCFAITFAITKNMVGFDQPLTIVFWMHVIQLPLGLLPALAAGWTEPPMALWPWIAVMGIAGFASHFCVAKALQLADATIVVPLDFLRLPIGAVIGWWVYAESLDPMVAVGALVIVAANWSNLRYG